MNPSDLQLVFRDGKGDLVEQGRLSAEEVQQRTDSLNARLTRNAYEDFMAVRDSRIEKPVWFLHEEQTARRFVYGELGLVAAKGTQITVIDSEASEAAQALFPWDVPGQLFTHGYYDHHWALSFVNECLQWLKSKQRVEQWENYSYMSSYMPQSYMGRIFTKYTALRKGGGEVNFAKAL